MADDSEEKPIASKNFASTAAVVLNTVNRLNQWRAQQIQQFRNKQLHENLKLSSESQKNFERALEIAIKSPEKAQNIFSENCNLSISEKNESDCYDTLQESSITGHLQRCFDDSSHSSLSANGNKITFEAQQSPISSELQSNESMQKNLIGDKDHRVKEDASKCLSVKPKRPFLKKGSGLLRYMPKSAANGKPVRRKIAQKTNNSPKYTSHVAQKTLHLKPAIRSASVSSESVKHIRFDIPKDIEETSNGPATDCNTPSFPKSVSTGEIENGDKSLSSGLTSSSSPEYCFSKNNKLEDSFNSGDGSLNLSKENKELEEFEMLENCAQNSSFNSDSSVVQRVLHGDKATISAQKGGVHASVKNMNIGQNSKEKSENPAVKSIFSNLGLSKCQEKIQPMKQILQKVILDINPRIQPPQKEISHFRDEALDDSDISERCSTPIEDLNVDNQILSSASPEQISNGHSPEFLAATASENANMDLCNCDSKTCSFNGVHDDSYSEQNTFEEDSAYEVPDLPGESNEIGNGRLKIQEKVLELEKEIKIYQEHNAKLASICKERDDIMRTLQKERENFEKYKEEEKKKLEVKIQEERRQIQRQKETFTRYQKLRKDNPTRKEREELNFLRQEVEKLQEELKRQKIKYTTDSRRWKSQIDAAEKERDSFKLENIRLEEQVQDLLSALKSRMKKKNNEGNPAILPDKTEEDAVLSVKGTSENTEVENHSQSKQPDLDKSNDPESIITKTLAEKKTRQKVRFNLDGECKEDLGNIEKSLEKKVEHLPDSIESLHPQELECEEMNYNKNVTTKKESVAVNLSVISVSTESEFKEIDHGNKIERIYQSGEREIIFPSGTRKIVKSDGLSVKFSFYNGDTKEIFPDKREVYRYVNGVTETRFPDGLETVEFPNGQIQRRYPDGQTEVQFPNGTIHNNYPDGSEELRTAEGNIVNLTKDGTETIKFANGQREIRTATYRRREFPDGSVKIVYDSGRQETRYSNGRIRIKDKDGKVIVDTKYAVISKG